MPRFLFTLDLVANKTRVEVTAPDAERHLPRGALGGQVVCVADYRNYEEACIAIETLALGLRFLHSGQQRARPIDLDLGKAAYEGYFKSCDGKSLISGAPLPMWEGQLKQVQNAWREGAAAVIRATFPAEASA